MTLFNITRDGGAEITAALGLISSRVDFELWKPILPLGMRDVAAITGTETLEELARFYAGDAAPETAENPLAPEALRYLQQAVALFSWLKIIPTLDVHHDENGRRALRGENEAALTALEQYKDEANIRHLAFEAVDALIETLDRAQFPFWTQSRKYRLRRGLLIRDKETFDEYYTTGSHRLFLTLLPMIREVQQATVAPLMGRDLLARLLDGDAEIEDRTGDTARRAIALLTMKKAVERLPVEVLPDGVVQVNQSSPVNQKLRAEKEARAAVAAALDEDAARYLRQLSDAVAEIRAEGAVVDFFVPGPIVHSKGISF